MDQQDLLMELEEAFDRLSCGVSAMKLMVLGLEDIQSAYADGFYAVYTYLQQAEEEARRRLNEVSTAQATA